MDERPDPKHDGMLNDSSWHSDALIWIAYVLIVCITAVFSAAMWALQPRLIYATIGTCLVLSLTVIWAVSSANGM